MCLCLITILLCVALPGLRAGDEARARFLLADGASQECLSPQFADGVWTGTDPATQKAISINSENIHHIFVVLPELENSTEIQGEWVKERKRSVHPLGKVPDRYQLELWLEWSSSPNLMLNPVADERGHPINRSLTIIFEQPRFWVRGAGGGRNQLQSFDRVQGTYTPLPGKEAHLRFFMDRNSGEFVMRINGDVKATGKIPGGTAETDPDKASVTLEPRQHFPQRIREGRVLGWSEFMAADADLKAAGGTHQLWLQNGDVLGGTLLQAGEKGIQLRLKDGMELELPWSVILEVRSRSS